MIIGVGTGAAKTEKEEARAAMAHPEHTPLRRMERAAKKDANKSGEARRAHNSNTATDIANACRKYPLAA